MGVGMVGDAGATGVCTVGGNCCCGCGVWDAAPAAGAAVGVAGDGLEVFEEVAL